MGDFRDSSVQVVVFQNLEVRGGHRMEEREVSKHCIGIGVMEECLESVILHGHWQSQGGCGEQLLKEAQNTYGGIWCRRGRAWQFFVGALADISVHGHV